MDDQVAEKLHELAKDGDELALRAILDHCEEVGCTPLQLSIIKKSYVGTEITI